MGKVWRAFGTGLCFFFYAVLTWLASLTVLPLLLVWPGSHQRRERRIRRLASASFGWLLAAIAFLRLGYVDVEGREWLARAQGKLIVATHPMYLDVVALLGLLPQADCVVKNTMWRNPFYRRFVHAIGYISNASATGLIDDCVRSLQRGRTLILFPEGTRTTPGDTVRLQRGAAQVAVRSGCAVLPVIIRCEPLALGKGQAWYQVAHRPWRLTIRFLPPRSLAELGYSTDMPCGVAARHVTQELDKLLTQQLETHEYADRRIETTHNRLA